MSCRRCKRYVQHAQYVRERLPLDLGSLKLADVLQSPESDPVEAVGLQIRKVSVCCMFIAPRDQYINQIVIWDKVLTLTFCFKTIFSYFKYLRILTLISTPPMVKLEIYLTVDFNLLRAINKLIKINKNNC